MKTSILFRLPLVLVFSLSTTAWAANADPGLPAAPLAGSVSVIQAGECNIAVSAGDDGVVVVDTCDAAMADTLLASVSSLSDKPIRFVIDTHAHGDHTGGNAVFQKIAPVIAQHSVRTRLETGNAVTKDPKAAPEALPMITFQGDMVLHMNGDDIRLLSLSPAHTDGDVVVFFKKANLVCMGDVFMPPAASFGDRHYGGGMLALIDALENLLPQIPADAKIVPGHGAISTRADIARGLEVLKGMKAVVEAAVKSGKSLEKLTAERPFDKWRDSVPTWSSSDKSLNSWVKDFYREIAPKGS